MKFLNTHNHFNEKIIANIYTIGEIALLLHEIVKCSVTLPFYWKRLA